MAGLVPRLSGRDEKSTSFNIVPSTRRKTCGAAYETQAGLARPFGQYDSIDNGKGGAAMPEEAKREVCVVAGIGPGNGEALARRFAADGYSVALLARRDDLTTRLAAELTGARAYVCDVADAGSVAAVFRQIRADLGEADVLVYNAGAGVWGNVESVSPADFEHAWRINTLGLFLASREVIPAMKQRGEGAIVVIGATASRRGVAGTAAFAPAKMAQRGLAESMARHLGPAGVHVCLIIVDGQVGGPVTMARYPGRPTDSFIDPNAVADIAASLVAQHRSAWSFEVEARPFNEKW
jgi:NAD(P)-dependent dehydrogenase (short-subunit alcohol dehydrogenase family)